MAADQRLRPTQVPSASTAREPSRVPACSPSTPPRVAPRRDGLWGVLPRVRVRRHPPLRGCAAPRIACDTIQHQTKTVRARRESISRPGSRPVRRAARRPAPRFDPSDVDEGPSALDELYDEGRTVVLGTYRSSSWRYLNMQYQLFGAFVFSSIVVAHVGDCLTHRQSARSDIAHRPLRSPVTRPRTALTC